MLKIDEMNIGRDTSYFLSTDTDNEYVVKPIKYFGLSQEEAGVHAAIKGAGLKDMLDKEGRTWMILRTRMTINKYARWMDEYKTETWCQKGYRLYCPRGVRAFDISGNLLFSSESLWVVMDINRMRPERPQYIEPRLPETKDQSLIFNPDFPPFEKSEDYAIPVSEKDVHIDYYDYDYNRHVNNLSYINWMISSFPSDYLDTHRPSFIDTEWKKQCHFEDKLVTKTTRKEGDENTFFTAIYRGDEIVFHGLSKWEEKK